MLRAQARPYILMVDDISDNLQVLASILGRADYRLAAAKNGKAALDMLKNFKPDLILMDIMMPELDGFNACKAIKENVETRDIPVVFITAMGQKMDIIRGFELGACDYVTKPFHPEELLLRVKNHIELNQLRFSLEKKVEEKISELDQANKIIRKNNQELLDRLLMTAEYRDIETGNHIKRVAEYSLLLAESLGMSSEEANLVSEASRLHDIGKIGIPDHILLKPGNLTPGEYDLIKNHTVYGKKILEGLDYPLMKAAGVIAMSHHEHYDGSGYPEGLFKDEIQISARIVTVADVFDALTSKRPYKKAWTVDRAKDLILEESSTSFDPDIVDAFSKNFSKIHEIYKTLKD